MNQTSFDIYTVKVTVGHAEYFRPCIIYENVAGTLSVWVLRLSTKNYSERGQSFEICSTHPDFPATGLTETSYTVHPMYRVERKRLRAKIGVINGALAKELLESLGL